MTPTLTRRAAIGAGFGALLLLSAPASALALTEAEAKSFVQEVVTEMTGLLKNASAADPREMEFRDLLRKRAAMTAIGRFTVGRPWRDMTDAQKAAFDSAFEDYIARTYVGRFGEYSGETVEVLDALDRGKKGVLVTSRVNRPAGSVVVEWLVSDRGGAPQLVDIIVEGVSLAITQREAFASMIEARGGDIDGFIQDLKSAQAG